MRKQILIAAIVVNSLVSGFTASRIGHPNVIVPACAFAACLFVSCALGLVWHFISHSARDPVLQGAEDVKDRVLPNA